MKENALKKTQIAATILASFALMRQPAFAGQAPNAASAPDIAVSSHDRVYLSDQSSNTVSVVDPATEKLLGVIRLGDLTPGNLSPLYKGQLLVHGMGFSPDHRTLDVVSIGSNSVTFIDTATNRVKHTTYVGRSPHEAFFTPDGREVWVTIRGENYIQVLDGKTYEPTKRIIVPNGPGMTIFSPDGRYGYIVSSFTPEMVVVDTKSYKIVGNVKQASPFSPDLAATPDGKQVWLTLKDIGKTQVINALPPFNTLALIDTGPITNHVNIVRNANGQFAHVTVGGLNEVKVFTTSDKPELVATIPVGALPHGLWPSGDGARIYIGLENGNGVTAIDTMTNKVVSTIASGQSPQGMVYIPNAVPDGAGTGNLTPLGAFGDAVYLTMGPVGSQLASTTVTVNNQGLVDLLQAAVTGIEPKKSYVLALSMRVDGSGPLEPVAKFMGNPAGAAIVGTLGPLRKVVGSKNTQGGTVERRYLVIATMTADGQPGTVVQVQR
ncbi:YncE family protein [Paraburkholderia fungorum]|uniref:YncE family protein n=1 Tax=Paraburkholderia fungorum TaxID=134537 RepID=UPI002091F2A1|nr:YncE family protein [Paraburkholderia fungorum]USU18516.1 YncE family protein [Paraburkholderia fungorum]USU26421.1 YncE family protein [Paraburkholderia fungorum]